MFSQRKDDTQKYFPLRYSYSFRENVFNLLPRSLSTLTCMLEQSHFTEVSQKIFVQYNTLQSVPGRTPLFQPFLSSLLLLADVFVATSVLLVIFFPAVDTTHMVKDRGPPVFQLLFEDN